MDVQNVIAVLQHTFNNNTEQRVLAEKKLDELESLNGYLGCLLQITTLKDVHVNIRQAASLRMKNIIHDHWSVRDGKAKKIHDQDRKVLRENLLEAVLRESQNVIRIQLIECMYRMCQVDFPKPWTTLFPSVMQTISSFKASNCDPARIYAALCVLYKAIYKKYQFKKIEDRKPLMDIVAKTFPVLLPLLQYVGNLNTIDGDEMSRLIIKCFFLAVQLTVPPYLNDVSVLSPWIQMLLKIFEKPLPKDQYPQGRPLTTSPLWKCKKWCSRIFSKVFARFGRPGFVFEKQNVKFSKMFDSNFSVPILNSFMNFLSFHQQTRMTTAPVLHSAYNFIENATKLKHLYKLIKPRLSFLLLESVFSTLCLSQADLQLWKEDPHEFVRKSLDLMQEFQDPRVSAINLLFGCIKIKPSENLSPVLHFIQKILLTYASTPPEKRNYVEKEGALRMLGAIRNLVLKKSQFRDAIEKVIVNHVFPEFQNPIGYMRARACWFLGRFCKFEYSSKQIRESSVKLVAEALKDKELPVKIESAISMGRMISNTDVVEILKPYLQYIVEQFFLLFDELGNEEVILTLGNLLYQMGNDVAPYAAKIFSKLISMFNALSQASEASPQDDESALSAFECIRSMNAILYACDENEQVFAQLEPIAAPLLDKLVDVDAVEFYKETLEMITCFTFKPVVTISPFMWSLLPRICYSLTHWAVDFYSEALPAIDNFIARGGSVFATNQNPNYLKMVLDICHPVLTKGNDMDAQYVCKILEAILAHHRFKVDSVVGGIVKLVCDRLFVSKDLTTKLLLIDVLAGAIYYNPSLFANILNQADRKYVQDMFDYWLSHLTAMRHSDRHLKVSLLGLSSLCLVPIRSWPQILQQYFSTVVEKTVDLSGFIIGEVAWQVEEENEDEDEDGEDDGDDDEDGGNDGGENGDDTLANDEIKQDQESETGNEGGMNDNEDEDSEEKTQEKTAKKKKKKNRKKKKKNDETPPKDEELVEDEEEDKEIYHDDEDEYPEAEMKEDDVKTTDDSSSIDTNREQKEDKEKDKENKTDTNNSKIRNSSGSDMNSIDAKIENAQDVETVVELINNHYETSVDEHICCDSPIDILDEIIFFAQSFDEFCKKEAEFCKQFSNSLDETKKQVLSKIFAEATDRRKAEQEKNKQQQQQTVKPL